MSDEIKTKLKDVIAMLDDAIEQRSTVLIFKAAAHLNLIIREITEAAQCQTKTSEDGSKMT